MRWQLHTCKKSSFQSWCKIKVSKLENTSLNSYIVTNLTSPVYSQNNGVSAVIIQNKIYLYPFRWIRTPSWTMQQIR